MVAPRTRQGHCTGERPLSFGARPWCDVPAAASKNQPAFAWHVRANHCAHCLSGGGASRKLSARARRGALVVVGPCTRKGHCTGERPLSFGVRLLCDVPAVVTQNRPAFAWHARARHFARCFSGEGAALELAVRAHRAALAVVVPRIRQGHCTGERSRSFGARPWCDVPVVATQNQPAFAWHRAGAPLRSLSLGRRRVTQACCARAPCRAGCCRFMHKARALHRRKASLLRRAAVVRRASGGHPESAGFRVARAGAPLCSLFLGGRCGHSSLLPARTVPRWLWSFHALDKGTVPARGLSPSARGCGATCQLRPVQEPAGFRVARASEPLRSLSLGRRRSTRACCCARAVPRWLLSIYAQGKGTAPARVLSPSARGRRRVASVRRRRRCLGVNY